MTRFVGHGEWRLNLHRCWCLIGTTSADAVLSRDPEVVIVAVEELADAEAGAATVDGADCGPAAALGIATLDDVAGDDVSAVVLRLFPGERDGVGEDGGDPQTCWGTGHGWKRGESI